MDELTRGAAVLTLMGFLFRSPLPGKEASSRCPLCPIHPIGRTAYSTSRATILDTIGGIRLRTEDNEVDRRFLTLAEVAEVLNISASQTYALVRNQDLRAIKIGGRGQYRVEVAELEAFIARSYDATDAFLTDHPFAADAAPAPEATSH